MNFHGQDIRAGDEPRGRHAVRVERAFIRAANCDGGRRSVRHRARRHVRAMNLRTVQIDHDAVVPQHLEGEVLVKRSVGDGEGPAKVGGDVFVRRVWPEADHRRLVAIAVAELARAVGPRAVVEAGRNPVRALVRAVVEVAPDRAGGDERGRGGRGQHQGKCKRAGEQSAFQFFEFSQPGHVASTA